MGGQQIATHAEWGKGGSLSHGDCIQRSPPHYRRLVGARTLYDKCGSLYASSQKSKWLGLAFSSSSFLSPVPT